MGVYAEGDYDPETKTLATDAADCWDETDEAYDLPTHLNAGWRVYAYTTTITVDGNEATYTAYDAVYLSRTDFVLLGADEATEYDYEYNGAYGYEGFPEIKLFVEESEEGSSELYEITSARFAVDVYYVEEDKTDPANPVYNVYTKNEDGSYSPIAGLQGLTNEQIVITNALITCKEDADPVAGGYFVCQDCGKHCHIAMGWIQIPVADYASQGLTFTDADDDGLCFTVGLYLDEATCAAFNDILGEDYNAYLGVTNDWENAILFILDGKEGDTDVTFYCFVTIDEDGVWYWAVTVAADAT